MDELKSVAFAEDSDGTVTAYLVDETQGRICSAPKRSRAEALDDLIGNIPRILFEQSRERHGIYAALGVDLDASRLQFVQSAS